MTQELSVLKKTLKSISDAHQKCKVTMRALWGLRSAGTTSPAVSALIREFKAEADTLAGQAVFLRGASEDLLLALISRENGELPVNGVGDGEGDGQAVTLEA